MTTSQGSRVAEDTNPEGWLFAEMRQAAREFELIPKWARPVVTVPYAYQPTNKEV